MGAAVRVRGAGAVDPVGVRVAGRVDGGREMTPFDLACDAVDVRDALVCLVRAYVDLSRPELDGFVEENADLFIFTDRAIWDAVEAAADLLDTLEGVLGCS